MAGLLFRVTAYAIECKFTFKGNLSDSFSLGRIGKRCMTKKTAVFINPPLLIKLLVGIGFLVFLLTMTVKAKCYQQLIGSAP